jgi:kumamolisin
MNRFSTPAHCVAVLSGVALVALAACAGQGPSSPIPVTNAIRAAVPPPAHALVSGSASRVAWGADEIKGATRVGPAQFGAMGVDIDVKLRSRAGLVQYAADTSNPKSPFYRHFLTPSQIGDRFGADQRTYNAVANYFHRYGLHVGGWPQHLTLFINGTQDQLQGALGTTFGIYQRDGVAFVAPDSAPHFSAPLAVTAVRNAVTLARFSRDFVPVRAGNPTLEGYSPAQIRQVFDYNGAYRAGYTGVGIRVGIIGTGGISRADVPAFGRMFNVPVAPVKQVDANDEGVAAGLRLNSPSPNPSASPPYGFPFSSGLSAAPPVTAQCLGSLPQCNAEDVEAQIDTEQAASLAPGSHVLFYLAYNRAECFAPGRAGTGRQHICHDGPNEGYSGFPVLGLALADDEIQQAIADDSADVVSLSYGGPESLQAGVTFDPNDPTQGYGATEFAALAAEGIAVFVASGDSGAETCAGVIPPLPTANQLCVSWPAVDPNVVSVGGVTTPMNQFGQLTNQLTAWGDQTSAGHGGSGGGVSTYFNAPSWQAGVPGVQGTMRNLPDVALEADSSTGVSVVLNAAPKLYGPNVISVGGTSVAAPEMAAMWALVLQACKQSSTCDRGGTYGYRLGNPAPLLYSYYGQSGLKNPAYKNVFYDIVYGDNAQAPVETGPTPVPSSAPFSPGYNAKPGYDLVTGLGVPFAYALIKAVVGE